MLQTAYAESITRGQSIPSWQVVGFCNLTKSFTKQIASAIWISQETKSIPTIWSYPNAFEMLSVNIKTLTSGLSIVWFEAAKMTDTGKLTANRSRDCHAPLDENRALNECLN
jgi:hypothetical protein